jgi:hypothetical protein
LKYIDPDGELAFLIPIITGAIIGGFMAGMQAVKNHGVFWTDDVWKGALIGAIGAAAGIGAGALSALMNGIIPGMAVGALAGGLMGGVIGGIDAALKGNGFWSGALTGMITGAVSGAVSGGITGGLNAKANGRNMLWGTRPYKDISLEIPFVMQDGDSWDCILANSEMLEKYFGGERSMEDFREILNNLPEEATVSDYFKAAGFDIKGSPSDAMQIIRTMEVNKFPTTITTVEGYNLNTGLPEFHNATITRVRMWRPKSNATFWVNDPIRGQNYKWSQKDLYKVIWDRFTIGGFK